MSTLTVDHGSPEWHAIRQKYIGSSEISALFGLHSYGLTRWQLYHQKKGNLPEVFEASVMTQGKHFEPAIASYAQEKFDIQLRKVRRYLVDDACPGLGASMDYEEFGSGSLIPTELKWSLWGKEWEFDGDELTRIPDSYLLQVQHQLAAAGAPHAQLIAFTAGDAKRMIIPRSDEIISRIRAAVTAFWADVAADREPPVDFLADADAVADLARMSPLRPVMLSPEWLPVLDEYRAMKATEKASGEQAEAAKAKLLHHLIAEGKGFADQKCVALCGTFKVTVSKIAENAGKLVTPEMVGTHVGGKAAHIRTTISEVKGK